MPQFDIHGGLKNMNYIQGVPSKKMSFVIRQKLSCIRTKSSLENTNYIQGVPPSKKMSFAITHESSCIGTKSGFENTANRI